MPKKHKKSYILVLLFTNFLNVFGWALLGPLYALYAVQLGASAQVVTSSWAFYALLAGLLMIAFGRFEDASPHKGRLLTQGYLIETIGIAVLLYAENTTWLFAGLGVYAVGMGVVTPVWKLMFARAEHKGREATEWGIFHGVNTLLISGAAATSGLLYSIGGFKAVIALMTAAHFGAMILSAAGLNKVKS